MLWSLNLLKTKHSYSQNMSKNIELTFDDIAKSHERIKNYIINTPIFTSEVLNKELGAQVFFKMENEQKIKAFKARGAFNAILGYKEKHGQLPEKVVASSSGNHAQGIAIACKELGLEALVYMAKNASPLKVELTRSFGAKVVLFEKRSEANRLAKEKAKEGYFYVHPADGDFVISGQGTAAFEALQEVDEVDAIFAPCGGGGLVSGSYLAAQGLSPKAKVFACEPLNANDAARSVRGDKIVGYEDAPDTIADGARTLSVTDQSFQYLKKLDGIMEIAEERIISWHKKFSDILGKKIEPTSALAIAGAESFLKNNSDLENPKILVIISGGNVAD